MTIFFMIIVNTPGSWQYVYPPLLHAKWNGCTPTDLVFPSFLFVIGMSMFISFKKNNQEKPSSIYAKIIKRALIIFGIGVFLNWFPFQIPFSELRYFGVLQRIALAYLGAAICITFLKKKIPIALTAILLMLLHWVLLYIFGPEKTYLELADTYSRHLDINLFGANHIYGGYGMPFDPEGLLGTLSSISQVILGYLTAQWVLSQVEFNTKVVGKMAGIGISAILIGLILNLAYPINKPLWTGSYVFYTSGIITLIWTALAWIVDIKNIKKWTFIFKVFGRNPLISYVLSILFVKIFIDVVKISDTNLYSWLYTNVYQSIFGNNFGSLMFALSFTLFIWLFAYGLHRKNMIIKL